MGPTEAYTPPLDMVIRTVAWQFGWAALAVGVCLYPFPPAAKVRLFKFALVLSATLMIWDTLYILGVFGRHPWPWMFQPDWLSRVNWTVTLGKQVAKVLFVIGAIRAGRSLARHWRTQPNLEVAS